MSRVGLFQGGCLLLGVCEGEGRPPVVTSVGGTRAIHKIHRKMRKKACTCFCLWEQPRFSSALISALSTVLNNITSKVWFGNHFTPREIKAVMLNNNERAFCARAAWILPSLQKHTACGQLSEVAATLAEIMHYDPKIDFFCGKKNPSNNDPVSSVYLLVCAGVCTCARPCVRRWMYTCLCTLEFHTCLDVLRGSDDCCNEAIEFRIF